MHPMREQQNCSPGFSHSPACIFPLNSILFPRCSFFHISIFQSLPKAKATSWLGLRPHRNLCPPPQLCTVLLHTAQDFLAGTFLRCHTGPFLILYTNKAVTRTINCVCKDSHPLICFNIGRFLGRQKFNHGKQSRMKAWRSSRLLRVLSHNTDSVLPSIFLVLPANACLPVSIYFWQGQKSPRAL